MLDPFRLVSLPWKVQHTTSIFLRANSCLSSFETGYMKHHRVCLRNLIKGWGVPWSLPISKVLTPRGILPVSWARKPAAHTYPCCTGWSGVSHGWTCSSPNDASMMLGSVSLYQLMTEGMAHWPWTRFHSRGCLHLDGGFLKAFLYVLGYHNEIVCLYVGGRGRPKEGRTPNLEESPSACLLFTVLVGLCALLTYWAVFIWAEKKRIVTCSLPHLPKKDLTVWICLFAEGCLFALGHTLLPLGPEQKETEARRRDLRSLPYL